MIEQIIHNNTELAIIIRNEYNNEGTTFFTPNDYSQQLGYMHHPKGKIIPAHTHNAVPRKVSITQEVLVIKKGSLKVDFYSSEGSFIKSTILLAGDIILLASGGHGFEVLEDTEMIEVKQGPYLGKDDKVFLETNIRV